MSKVISALEARNNLGSLLDDVNRYNTRFIIKKRNNSSAVLINFSDYLQNIVKKDPTISALQSDANSFGSNKMTQSEVNKAITTVRNHVKSSH